MRIDKKQSFSCIICKLNAGVICQIYMLEEFQTYINQLRYLGNMQEVMKNTMKGVVALEYGEEDPKFQFRENLNKPIWNRGKKQLLIRVLAASIGYGDIHMLSGKVRGVLKVKGGFPYILGKDLCGVVEEADEGSKFKKGDIVVGQTPEIAGTIAEYVLLPENKAAYKPEHVGIYEAAASVDSSNTAYYAVNFAKVQEKDRVLVIGGSGGVGSAAIQIAKVFGAHFVATTSTQKQQLLKLGVDKVIDYREENWWEIEQFRNNHLDVIIDCVGGNEHYEKSLAVLKGRKDGGRFIPVCGADPNPQAETFFQFVGFGLGMLKKPIASYFNKDLPDYPIIVTPPDVQRMDKVLELIGQKKLTILFQKSGPFELAYESVRKAFLLQASHHAYGKIVFKIGDF